MPTLNTGVLGAFSQLVPGILKLLLGICTPSTPTTYGSSTLVCARVSRKNTLATFCSSYRPWLNNRYQLLQSPSAIPSAINPCVTVCLPKLKISPNTIPITRQYTRSCPNASRCLSSNSNNFCIKTDCVLFLTMKASCSSFVSQLNFTQKAFSFQLPRLISQCRGVFSNPSGSSIGSNFHPGRQGWR